VVRWAEGFGYYGIILTTTELMQMNDPCYGLFVCMYAVLRVIT